MVIRVRLKSSATSFTRGYFHSLRRLDAGFFLVLCEHWKGIGSSACEEEDGSSRKESLIDMGVWLGIYIEFVVLARMTYFRCNIDDRFVGSDSIDESLGFQTNYTH